MKIYEIKDLKSGEHFFINTSRGQIGALKEAERRHFINGHSRYLVKKW